MIQRKINKFQPGGAVPQEQQQAPEMPVEEIVMQVKQALEQGADIVEVTASLLQQMDEQQVIAVLETVGVPPEQIQQIMAEVMQGQGGQEPGMGGEQEQMMQMIAQGLQQGASPEELVQALTQQGLSPEQAQQAVMAVAQQMQQGGGQQQPGQEQMMQDGGLVGGLPPGILGEANDAGYAPYNPPGYSLRKGSTYQEDPENWIYWKKDDKVYRKDLFDGSYSELRPPTKDDLKFLKDFSKWANSSEAKSEEVQKKYNKEIKPLLNSLDRPIRPASNPRDKDVEQMIADGSFCDDCTYRYSAYDEFDFEKVPIPEDYPEVSVLEDSEVQKSKPGYKYRYHRERNPFTSQYEVMSPTQHKMLEREAYKLRNQGIKPTIDNMPIIENRELLDVVTRKPVGTRPWSGKNGVGWTEEDVIYEKNKDFYKSDTSEQAGPEAMMQLGGQAGSQEEEIQQLIMAYAQISGTFPEEIMAQLQQAPPEQQQQMMQQMMQAVQQAQQGGGQQMAPEQGGQPMMQMGGQAGNQEEQMMQLIQDFAQIVGADPNDIIADIQEASEEEQQEMVQQMIDTVQQSQGGAQQQSPMAVPQARKGVSIENAVVEHIVGKMLKGGVTKKDFQVIAKDMIKEMAKGGAVEFDASSKDNFVSNLKGSVANFVGTNLKVGEIKRNTQALIESLQGLKKNKKSEDLSKAELGAVTFDELRDKTKNLQGRISASNVTDDETETKQETNNSGFDMNSFLQAYVAAQNNSQNPMGQKQRPPIFHTDRMKIKGTGSLKGASYQEMQDALLNPGEGFSVSKETFAKNMFGKDIENPNRVARRINRNARGTGVRYNITQNPTEDVEEEEILFYTPDQIKNWKQEDRNKRYNKRTDQFKNLQYKLTSPFRTAEKISTTAADGMEVMRKRGINFDNLLDRTIGGMHDFNRLAEQQRGFDPQRELADRQKVFTAADTLDPGLYSDAQMGKFNPREMGTGEYAGTGNDSFARGRAVGDSYMGELGLIVKKLGGTVDNSGRPRFPNENKLLEQALKHLESKGVKYRK
jgi:hypothetical protein